MNRISLVAVPLLLMFIGAIVSGANINASGQISFNSGSVSVNGNSGSFNMQPVSLPNLLAIGVIVGVALAVCIASGVKVLGSGISGSAVPIIFMVTILTAVFTVLSGLAYNVYTGIPVVGYPLYFGLVVAYVVGVAGLAVGGGGD